MKTLFAEQLECESVQEGRSCSADALKFQGGAEDGTRTRDLLITNQLLYQLSYFGIYEENSASRSLISFIVSLFCIPSKIGIRM